MNRMRKKFGELIASTGLGTNIAWGHTNLSNVIGEFKRTTVAYMPSKHAKLESKEWQLFKCKICGYVTHAISLNQEEKVESVGDAGGSTIDGVQCNRDAKRLSAGASSSSGGGGATAGEEEIIKRTTGPALLPTFHSGSSHRVVDTSKVAIVTNLLVKDALARNFVE